MLGTAIRNLSDVLYNTLARFGSPNEIDASESIGRNVDFGN
jgi:hypothetical protein